jgi:phage terminase large subunit
LTELKIKTPRWALPLLDPTKRYCGAWGGRGSGKSYFFAEAIVEAHVMNPNSSTLCVREVQKSLSQSVKRLIEERIEALGASAYFDIKHDEIRMKRGRGRILFIGMSNTSAETIKSLNDIDRCWVEEAQVLSETSLQILRPTIRNEGSQIWFSWNPRRATDPVDAFLRPQDGSTPDDAAVVRVNYDDNPWFPEVLRQEMERDYRRDAARARHVWEGEYLEQTESAVFRNWVVEDFDSRLPLWC